MCGLKLGMCSKNR